MNTEAQPITIGSVWRNNDPYEGECSFIIGLPVKNSPGYYECVMCDCVNSVDVGV